MKEIKVNSLPVPTWNWLRVNNEKLIIPESVSAPEITFTAAEGIITEGPDIFVPESGMGEDFSSFVSAAAAKRVYIEKASDDKSGHFTIIENDYSDREACASSVRIVAGEGSEMNVFLAHRGGIEGEAFSDIRIKVEKGAKVRLIEVFAVGKEYNVYDNIGAELAEDSALDIVHIVSSGKEIFLGAAAELAGDRSRFGIDNGYIRSEGELLDINYVARHRGHNSESGMYASGVLRKNASKCFRGTIDFIQGCSGAKGDEREDVLLMDPSVVNKTVPLILCSEEDVEGTHGASIGKLSEDILFYFETRGIEEKDVIRLMADSKLDAVIGQISDEDIRSRVKTIAGRGDEE